MSDNPCEVCIDGSICADKVRQQEPGCPFKGKRDIGEMQKEIDRLKDQNLRMLRGEFGQICAYCLWESPSPGDSWGALQEHIHTCPEHPLTKTKAVNQEMVEALEDVVKRLEGFAWGKEHVAAWKEVIRKAKENP